MHLFRHVKSGFFGEHAEAMGWLATDMDALRELPGWTGPSRSTTRGRPALAAYRKQLPLDANIDAIAESLLHMHHNRAIGIDPDRERTCRRLARQAALTWRTRHQGGQRQ